MTLTPWRLRLLLASLLTVSFLGALDHTIVATSLSTIAGELGALDQLSWVLVSYTLAATVLLPLLGKLGDSLGARRIFLASLALFILASIACGFAQTMPQLVGARVLQGLSSAGLQLMSQTIVAAVTTPRERPKLLSILGASFPVAILVGPLLGGLISDHLGWPWVFWINVPLGVAAFVLAVIAIPHIDGRARGRFDVAGAVTFTLAMVALVVAITVLPHSGTTGLGLALLGAAALLFTAFFFIEAYVDDPFIPLRFFRNRTIAAGITLSAVIGIGLFSVVSYIPTYIQLAYRTTATVSGLVPIAIVFGMLVSSLLTGFLASRTGRYRRFAIFGTSVAATGLGLMALVPAGAPLWVPVVLMGMVGIGTGSFMSLVIAVVQSAVEPTEVGSVTATTNVVRQVGATLGTAIIGAVIGAGIVARIPAALDPSTLTPKAVRALSDATQAEIASIYSDVMSPVFIALAATYAVGLLAAILLPRGRLSAERPVTAVDPEPQSLHQSA